MTDANFDYPQFIKGERLDLVVPTKHSISEGWAGWFNDPKVTRWISQGAFPNTPELQSEFLEDLKNKQRLALMIYERSTKQLLGTISLSAIDFIARSAQISIIIGKESASHHLVALEAMALMTDHAFQVMGLERLWASQPYPPHAGFNASLETIGYWADGIIRNSFRKGQQLCHATMSSCLLSDYEILVKRRGALWPGYDKIMALLLARRQKGLAARIDTLIADERALLQQAMADDEARAFENPRT